MKKLILMLIILLGAISNANATKKLTYLEEIQQLGDVAGQGLACRARKYQQYELLARALLVTKSPSDKLQKEAMQVYNSAKIDAYASIIANNSAGCDQIVYNFNRQKIFKTVLYADGRIKLYDGTFLKPRKLYDAGSLYKKDPNVYDKAYASYKKALAQAEKKRQTAPKLELRDANYSRYANQF